MRKRLLVIATLVSSLMITSLAGCADKTSSETTTTDALEVTTKESTTELTTEEPTTEEPTTEEPTTEEPTTEEPTTLVYADWIDTLHSQMVALQFDDVIATISDSGFQEKCAIYEDGKVSWAYDNTCYKLPISTGGQISVVVVGTEITVIYCASEEDEHRMHKSGFEYVGYGDICVVYGEDGTVTCDGVHVKSQKKGQTSFDMEEGGIWIVWSV